MTFTATNHAGAAGLPCGECGGVGLVYERYLQEWVVCRACDQWDYVAVAQGVKADASPLLSERTDS